MDFEDFKRSVAGSAPPPELSGALGGLWWDAKGDWNKAHECAQEEKDAIGAWVHAYLHRKEGDLANASYWYRLAGKTVAEGSLEGEWAAIARALLAAA